MEEIHGGRNLDAHLQEKQSRESPRQVVVVDGCISIADYGSDACKDIALSFFLNAGIAAWHLQANRPTCETVAAAVCKTCF